MSLTNVIEVTKITVSHMDTWCAFLHIVTSVFFEHTPAGSRLHSFPSVNKTDGDKNRRSLLTVCFVGGAPKMATADME